MLKKITYVVLGVMMIVALSGCVKENKINEYDKEDIIKVFENEELIKDADYSEGNIVVPYINIFSSEVDEINNFLRGKAEELRSYEFEEIDGEKFFIHSAHYTYYLDEQILSILFVEHSSEDDGYDWYYSYNIDLKNNKVLTTEYIISKLINDEKSKELDEKVLDELDKKLANETSEEYYRKYGKDFAVREYLLALQTFNVQVYVKEEDKIAIVIPIEHYDLIVDMDIKLSDLFKETTNKDNNKDIKKIKGKVLDFSISDYKEIIINHENPYGWQSNDTDYGTLMEKAYYAEIFPEKVENLYGTYISPVSIGDGLASYCNVYAATSTLNDGKYDYSVDNLSNELDKNISWVEGKEGYGIGEKITIYMIQDNEFCQGNMIEGYKEVFGNDIREKDTYNTSFNGIYIVNGYAETEKLYKANSRIKKLKLTIDDKTEYILELEDTMMPQIFDVNYKTSHAEKLYPIKAEFEILEVYKGEKYEDTALNTLCVGFDSDAMSGGR